MEKRVIFQNRWLPYVLVAPQLLITLVFFFLPAGQAIEQSVMMQDAFGLSNEFVGLANFQTLFADPNYIESFKVTMLFSVLCMPSTMPPLAEKSKISISRLPFSSSITSFAFPPLLTLLSTSR